MVSNVGTLNPVASPPAKTPFVLSPVAKTLPVLLMKNVWKLPAAAKTMLSSKLEEIRYGVAKVVGTPLPSWL